MNEAAEQRFWSKVDARGDCWTWTACLVGGYGQFNNQRTKYPAHRVAYELLVGPIPHGLVIDHLCRNRACVNPDHLQPVTIQTNTLRGVSRQAVHARRTHCPQGHPYDKVNTMLHPVASASRGVRYERNCRECRRRRRHERYQLTGQ